MKISSLCLFSALLVLGLHESSAATFNWTETGGGNYVWSGTSGWVGTSGTYPNAAGAVANMNDAIVGTQTISLGQNITIGVLNIGASNGLASFKISGPNSLIFDSGIVGTAAQINVDATSDLDLVSTNVSLNSNLVVTSSAATNFTISGNISEGGIGQSLTLNGTGALVLSGSNSYSGGTILGGGTLIVSADQNLGAASGSLTLSGGALSTTASFSSNRGVILSGASNANDISVAGSTVLTLSGTLSGANGLAVTGPGTLVLTNTNNSFGGLGSAIALNAGILSVGSDLVLGNTNNTLTFNGGALNTTANFASSRGVTLNEATNNIAVAGSTTLSLSGSIGGSGGLAATGPGTLALGGANTYSGGTYLDAGIVQVSGSQNLGSAASALNFAGGSLEATASFADSRNAVLGSGSNTVIVDASKTLTEAGTWGGSGGLIVSGSGTLALSGSNNYGGGTTVSGGNLSIAANANLGTGSLTLAAGNLSTTGSFGMTRNVILNSGANVIDVAAGSSLQQSGLVSGVGGFTLGGGGQLALSGNNSYSGGTEINNGTLTVSADANLGNASGGVTIDEAGTLESASSFSTHRTFVLTGSASGIMVDSGATLTEIGLVSGTGGLLKSGGGTLVLANANNNTYGGSGNTIALNAGTLSIGADGAMGNGANTLTMNGGALSTTASFGSSRGMILNSATNDIAVGNLTTLTWNGIISGLQRADAGRSGNAGADECGQHLWRCWKCHQLERRDIERWCRWSPGQCGQFVGLQRGSLSTTANFASSRGLTLNEPTNNIAVAGSTTLSLSGTISGTGGLAATGPGTLALGGTNTYSGGTYLNAGDVQVSASQNLGGGALNFAGGSIEATASFADSRNALLGSGPNTVIVDASQTLNESGTWSGNGGLTVSGAGTLTLSGSNGYGGGTTVSGGNLSIAANDNIGPGSLSLSAGTLSTTANIPGMTRNVILNSGANAIDVAIGTSLGESGVVSGAGGFALGGGGQLVLSASNTYSGGTEIKAGTLTVYANSNLGNTIGGLTIDEGGTLESGSSFSTVRSMALTGPDSSIMVDPGVTLTAAGRISGAGGLVKSGSGTLVLGNAGNTFGSGGNTIAINAGTLMSVPMEPWVILFLIILTTPQIH